MSRIRTIKPRFMMSRDTAKLSLPARLFFLQLLTELDDEGRLNYSAKQLAGTLYPHDEDVDGSDVRKWVKECCAATMLVVYRVGGHQYLYAPKFRVHQKINKPQKSYLPDPTGPDSEVLEGTLSGDNQPPVNGKHEPSNSGNEGAEIADNSGKTESQLPELPTENPGNVDSVSPTPTGKPPVKSRKTTPKLPEGRGMEEEEEKYREEEGSVEGRRPPGTTESSAPPSERPDILNCRKPGPKLGGYRVLRDEPDEIVIRLERGGMMTWTGEEWVRFAVPQEQAG